MNAMSRILMVTSEATPFCKTGGLADVLGALPPALVEGGDKVGVVLPLYRGVSLEGAKKVWSDLSLWVGPGHYTADVWMVEREQVPYYLIDIPVFYDRPGLYGINGIDHWDND